MTHKKIAELANVSVSTVSKALSGSKEVSGELTEKIRKIALETGYFKEKNKKKIEYMKNKPTLIAVVCPEIISIHYSDMITSIKNEVEKRNGLVAVYVYDFDFQKLTKIMNTLSVSREVDGIITFSEAKFNIRPNIPVVCIGEECSDWCDTVYSGTENIFLTVIEHLKALNHKKIAYVGETNTIQKQSAFLSAMEKSGLFADSKNIYNISERFERIGEVAAEKIVSHGLPFSAYVTAYDEVAIGLIHGFSKHNICVPKDVSVVGINDIPHSKYSVPPLTTVKIAFFEQCNLAVGVLYDKILNKTNDITHIAVNHELVIRSSTDICKGKE